MAKITLQIGQEPEEPPIAYFDLRYNDRRDRLICLINGIAILRFTDDARVFRMSLSSEERADLAKLGYKFNEQDEIVMT